MPTHKRQLLQRAIVVKMYCFWPVLLTDICVRRMTKNTSEKNLLLIRTFDMVQSVGDSEDDVFFLQMK